MYVVKVGGFHTRLFVPFSICLFIFLFPCLDFPLPFFVRLVTARRGSHPFCSPIPFYLYFLPLSSPLYLFVPLLFIYAAALLSRLFPPVLLSTFIRLTRCSNSLHYFLVIFRFIFNYTARAVIRNYRRIQTERTSRKLIDEVSWHSMRYFLSMVKNCQFI